MKILLLCFFIFGVTFTSSEERVSVRDLVSANLNKYVDSILPAIRDYIVKNNMDPMAIPDIKEGFSATPIIITYHGELELTKGLLFNLRSIKRSADITVGYINKLVKITGDLRVDDIKFDYAYLAKIMNIGPTGTVEGKLSKMSVYVDFLVDFNNMEIHLQDMYLHDVGTIDIKLHGNSLLDWLLNALVSVITSIFKNDILSYVEGEIKQMIEDYINDVNNSIHEAENILNDLRRNIYPPMNYSFSYALKQ